MRAPYGFELSENCQSCQFRGDGFFCQLSPAELSDFDAIKSILACPANFVLFAEGHRARGFFQLCQGDVRLFLTSREGHTVALRTAWPGDVIGLWAALSGGSYEATAEAIQPCQVAFISATDFRRYLRRHPAASEHVFHRLGLHYQNACKQLSIVGLGSIFNRVIDFLLDWSARTGMAQNGTSFPLPMSHEKIAEYLGTTRESITRVLCKLRRSGLIERHGSTFVIPDRDALGKFHRTRSHPSNFALN